MLRAKLLFTIPVLAVLAMPTPASAQWTETKYSHNGAGDQLGNDSNVDISGDIGIVGGWPANGNSGKAYLFDVTTGLQTHEPSIVQLR